MKENPAFPMIFHFNLISLTPADLALTTKLNM